MKAAGTVPQRKYDSARIAAAVITTVTTALLIAGCTAGPDDLTQRAGGHVLWTPAHEPRFHMEALIEGHLGVTETVYEGVNVGEKDFSALIAKLKQQGVNVLYWGGLHAEAGLIIRQLADQGLKVQFISGDGIVSNELASIAGDAVAGTLNTFGPDPRNAPANAELVKKFRDAGFEPEAYTLYSYAAVQSLAGAAKAAGSNDPQ